MTTELNLPPGTSRHEGGGRLVGVPFLDLHELHAPLKQEILADVAELIDSCAFANGPAVAEFEAAFARFCDTPWCVGVSSGLDALRLGLIAAGIGPGDEVIVPANTFIATVEAVSQAGAVPVLADAGELDHNVDPAAVESAITPRTRALIPVHLYGRLADMAALSGIAARHGLVVLEDACQAHGAARDGIRAGRAGVAAAFSFYVNKVMTTGEGGMVVTDDAATAVRVRSLRDQGFSPQRRFVHDELGFNYRMTNLQAALGVAQVRRVDVLVQRKRDNAARYRRLLEHVPGLRLPPEQPWARSVYWMFGVLVDDEFGLDRDTLMAELAARGIETRSFFVPLHRQPLYAAAAEGVRCPVADELSARGLYLPSGTGLTADEIDRVVDAIESLRR